MSRPQPALSDKEKEVLRLLLRGHDAKTAARALDLSVHTLNERLRSARRKLGAASSREAALMLGEMEGETNENFVPEQFGMGTTPPPLPFVVPPKPLGTESPAMELREAQAAYRPMPLLAAPVSGLPLRPEGSQNNDLNRAERAKATADLTVKLATAFALICLAFILISTLLKH